MKKTATWEKPIRLIPPKICRLIALLLTTGCLLLSSMPASAQERIDTGCVNSGSANLIQHDSLTEKTINTIATNNKTIQIVGGIRDS